MATFSSDATNSERRTDEPASGERGPAPLQIAFSAFVIWLGWQGFVNVLRYQAVSSNMSTLSAELNHGGEAVYRQQLLRVLGLNSADTQPSDIEVAFDEPHERYQVTVRSRWTLDFGWWRFERPLTHRLTTARSRVLHHGG